MPTHSPGPVLRWPDFNLLVAVLEHHGPCLGFAVQEPLHVNVWRDADRANARAHLTTRAAGEMARGAGVRRVEPFHFSPRYEGEEARMLAEVATAFAHDGGPSG